MTNDERDEQRLSRLLRAVHAEPDSAALRLALTRLSVADQPPRWLAWTLRPIALGTAAALLLCTTSVSWWWLSASAERSSLTDQVMAAAGASSVPDLDVSELDLTMPRAPSGTQVPRDSGGLE